jgi:hypothetical protein
MRGAQTQSASHIEKEIGAFDKCFSDNNEGYSNPNIPLHYQPYHLIF